MGQRQLDRDPLAPGPPPAVGELPEEPVQALVDPRLPDDRDRQRQLARAQHRAVDQRHRDRRERCRAAGEGVVEQRHLGGGDRRPDGLEGPAGEGADRLPRAQQIAGPEQLGAEAAAATDPANDEPGEQQQAEAVGLGVIGPRVPRALGDPLDPRPAGARARPRPSRAGEAARQFGLAGKDLDDCRVGAIPDRIAACQRSDKEPDLRPFRRSATPRRLLGSIGDGTCATKLGGEEGLLIALALAVGVGAGVGAIGFRYLIEGFTWLFTGHTDPSALGHFTNPHLAFLGPFVVLVVPILGGLLYGPLVYRFAPEARGHGVPEVMLAVHQNEGKIRGRVPIVKSLASAITIGAGGSVGREGPIVQIGSAIGSGLGQLTHQAGENTRLLVACGAAGGIAATFNAPIAGVFFALELILRNFETRSFGLVVLASVVATAVGRIAFGSEAFLTAARLPRRLRPRVPALRAARGARRAGRRRLHPRPLRRPRTSPTGSGAAPPGCARRSAASCSAPLLLVLPEMYGVGYPVLEGAIHGQYVVGLLLGLPGRQDRWRPA